MLTIAKMGIGQENYYLSKVATGLNDYYSGDGEVDGVWAGRGAERLGLDGTVDAEALKALLAGRHPNGDRLSGRAGMAHTPGWDLTFSAPKSVSILYALGGIEAAQAVVEAHDRAVAEAIGWLEAYATTSRRRIGGEITMVAGEGLVVAGFRHRTSRLGDPQLHTHALVSNVVERDDGTWGALHSRPLYVHARTAGFLYQAVLRAELTTRLGVEWTAVDNGVAEITDTSSELKALFSKRRAQIEAAMTEAGEHPDSARAAQVAAYRTRPAKPEPETGVNLYARWEAEATEAGIDVDAVLDVIGRTARQVTVDDVDVGSVIDRLVDPAGGLCSSDSNFDRAAVARAWCARLPTGTRLDHAAVEALIDRAVDDRRIVEIDAGGSGPVVIAADGAARRVGVGDRRWTTTELLEVERQLLANAKAVQAQGIAVVDDDLVEAALGERPELGDDQVAMVRHLARSGNAVDVVVGRAGTGKTYALAASVALWRAAGYEPVGVALAARAAAELGAGAGLRASTIAQMFVDADRSDQPILSERSILVVDEAGMVDTRRLAALIDMAHAADAKVVLVGDHHQLPAVETGGSFAELVELLDPVELVENRRQIETWEADCLARLRAGAGGRDGISKVIADYDGHDRVRISENPAEVRAVMAMDWYRAHTDGEHALMVALRRDDVVELNVRARAMLVDDGTLDDTHAIVAGTRVFTVGDRIVCLRNDRRLGVHNALAGTITNINLGGDSGPVVTFETTGGNRHAVPWAYLDDGHVDHGYATTIHKAQGATVDRCLVLGDDRLYRQAGYTALSRGRHSNDLYLIGIDDRDQYPELELDRHGSVVDDQPVDRIVRALHRDGAKELATTIAQAHSTTGAQAHGESLRELWQRWDTIVADLGEIPDDPSSAIDATTQRRDDVAERIVDLDRRRAWIVASTSGWRRWTHTPNSASREHLHRLDTQVSALRDQHDDLAGRLDHLDTAQEQRDVWLNEHDEQLAQLDKLADHIEWRTSQAGRAAEIERPVDVVAQIGEPPPGDRTAWRAAAGAIESYNARWADHEPAQLADHPGHDDHLDQVESLVHDLQLPPVPALPEPTLTL